MMRGRIERLSAVLLLVALSAPSNQAVGEAAAPPDELARKAVEQLDLAVQEGHYWTEHGVLSHGETNLRDYDWAEDRPWVRELTYERLVQTKRSRVEPIPRYTVDIASAHVRSLRELPWVQPVAGADEHLILGQSHGWPAGKELDGWTLGDPAVPPQNVYGYTITDPDTPDDQAQEKIRIVLVGGNHPIEMHGNWALHGMLDFLVSDDPRAATLRQKAVFYVYPLVNPDGRYLQSRRPTVPPDAWVRTRGNPELHAAGEGDHNRVWHTGDRFSTIGLITASMHAATGGEADYLWDFHGGHPHDPGDYRATSAGTGSSYSRALEAREAPYPEVLRRTSSGNDRMVRIWAMSEQGLNVPYSFTFEPGRQLDKQAVLVAGKNLALGFYDVVTGQAPEPLGLPEPDPSIEPEAPDPPVAAWLFHGDADAVLADDIDAELHHPQWSSQTRFDRTGNRSLALDGSQTYVDLGRPEAVTAAEAITVAAWVRSDAGAGSSRYIVSRWQPSGNQRAWALTQLQNSGRMSVFLTPEGSFSQRKVYETTFNVFDGTWRHLAFTYQPGEDDGALRLFVDGVEFTEANGGLNISDDDRITQLHPADAPLLIGAWAGPGRFFEGLVDEAAIWDRALTPQQIKWLAHNSVRQLAGPTPDF